MVKISRRKIVFASVLFMLMALLLMVGSAFAISGDYGVTSGALASSGTDCASTRPCQTTTWNGYNLTLQSVSGDTAVYDFDDYNCTLTVVNRSSTSMSGTGCPSI